MALNDVNTRQCLAFMEQDSFVFEMSIQDNITVGLEGNVDEADLSEVCEISYLAKDLEEPGKGGHSMLSIFDHGQHV
jgi:ABC-type bacteriocin/lantibiotic exporter with double-glycine peptidase domain